MPSPKGPRSNAQPARTRADDRRDDLWKTSPSTEVTGDAGENARRAGARKVAENAPRKRGPHGPPKRDPERQRRPKR